MSCSVADYRSLPSASFSPGSWRGLPIARSRTTSQRSGRNISAACATRSSTRSRRPAETSDRRRLPAADVPAEAAQFRLKPDPTHVPWATANYQPPRLRVSVAIPLWAGRLFRLKPEPTSERQAFPWERRADIPLVLTEVRVGTDTLVRGERHRVAFEPLVRRRQRGPNGKLIADAAHQR